MRYFILLIFYSFFFNSYSQVIGDFTGDDIIDANDYLKLKEAVLQGELIDANTDLDKNGVQNIRDLVLLYDFLFAGGTQINALDFEEKKKPLSVLFGQFDAQKNSLEIIIKSSALKGFEINVSNLELVELEKEVPNIFIVGNKIIGFHQKKYFNETLVLHLKLANGILDELCLESPFFVDEVGNTFPTSIGDCANPSWTTLGLIKVKEAIQDNGFDEQADIDRNGKVDLKDYAVLFDYINLNGSTPPGVTNADEKRVQIEFLPAEKEQDYVEIVLSASDEFFAFDISLSGLEKIVSVEQLHIDDVEFTDDRILWYGNGEKGQREIKLKVGYQGRLKSKKICARAPVFLDENHQYFDVKLGKCFEIFVKKIIPPVVVKVKKEKVAKPVKVKKEKAPKKEKTSKKIKDKKEVRSKPKKVVKAKKGKEKKKPSKKEVVIKETGLQDTTTTVQNVAVDTAITSPALTKESPAAVLAPKAATTVKILSLNNLKLKTALGKKGQLIFNSEENIFMIFNGKTWKKLKAKPGNSIAK
jgi:hypothetical protein